MRKISLLILISLLSEVLYGQGKITNEDVAYCKLGNIETFTLSLEPKHDIFIQKFVSNEKTIIENLKYSIPSLKEQETFADCVIAFDYYLNKEITQNGDIIYYGNIVMSCIRDVRIKGVECKLAYNLTPVWSIQSTFITINPELNSEACYKLFADISSTLINQFAVDYYKAN